MGFETSALGLPKPQSRDSPELTCLFRWGDFADLNEVGLYWFHGPVMTSIISGLGQIFYAWRIWVLKKRTGIPVVIIVLALVQAGAGIWSGSSAHLIGHFSEVQTINFKDTCVWLIGTALCDIIITMSMTYTLLTSRSGLRSTNAIIVRIVRLTIETGAVCAIFAVLDLTLFLRFPHNNFHLSPSIALSKLYSNSLFAVSKIYCESWDN
ncbi:hypothetical protein BDZ94DRAFT_1177317 [Collybia nuda]|uniref:DUF6534 domain-containing protein n=1 Tax=Collybia nuda TaxID=64659 RepID=A0A9P5XTN1_9AGAR|nr:hypothetical protein BDZ94DRAFT_1177317 [Collybia nuda]